MLTFETLCERDIDRFVELQANAFMDYEFFSRYVPNERRRRRFLTSLFTTDVRVNWGTQHFLAARDESGNIVAVAALREPGYVRPSNRSYLKAGVWRSILAGGYRTMKAWLKMEDEEIVPCQELTDDWFVNLLAVDANSKGQGLGTKMLKECVIPYVKEHGGSHLCLFTNAEINRRFYEKNGFTEFDERFFEHDGHAIGSWSYRQAL